MDGDLKQALGARIRASRRMSRMTQEQLAERIDKSVQTVSSIERGVTLPALDTLWSIALALQVPLPVLLMESQVALRARQEKEFEGLRILQLLSDGDLDIALAQLRAWAQREGRT
jgi:transcriptional regulator with XRE-family HTH domain